MELGGPGEPQRIEVTRSSAELFPLLGVEPLIGRVFTRAEDTPGHDVVVLSHRFWQRVFSGRTTVVGETVRLDRRPFVIIGVMPVSFEFPRRGPIFNGTPADAWIPIAFTADEKTYRGCCFSNSVLARLKEGVEIEQARAEVRQLGERIRQTYPAVFLNTPYRLVMSVASFREEIAGQIRGPLLVLFASVSLVLVVVCANVANLIVSRAAARQREIAVRLALGATRTRLLQFLVCESLTLSAAGGVLGLICATAVLRAVPAFLTTSLPGLADVGLDVRVVAFTAGISLLTAIACGIAPLYASDRDVGSRLHQGSGRTVVEGRGHLLQRALVATTVALAAMLLVGAGLLVRSFAALLSTEPGFQPQRVLTMSVTLPRQAYRDPETVFRFARAAFGGIRTVPGVRSTSISTDVPLESNVPRSMVVETGIVLETAPLVSATWFYGDYFQTLGVPLVRGRLFTSEEQDEDREVAIVSVSLVNRYWHGQNPLGKRIKWGLGDFPAPWKTIVGVVGDVRDGALRDTPKMHVYVPFRTLLPEMADEPVAPIMWSLRIALRAGQEPSALVPSVRQAIAAIDSVLPVTSIATKERRLAESVAPQRFSTMVLAAFALSALLLAAVGLYGVLAFAVAQRTREIGVRIALGAQAREVILMIIRQGMRLVILGLVIGLAAAVGLARAMTALLYRTEPLDPRTFVAAPLVLTAVALLACYLPARRAARIEPLTALRTE
jgi:predicted permease